MFATAMLAAPRHEQFERIGVLTMCGIKGFICLYLQWTIG